MFVTTQESASSSFTPYLSYENIPHRPAMHWYLKLYASQDNPLCNQLR